MIPIFYKVTENIGKKYAIERRGFSKILKVAMQKTLLHWHKNILPKHFAPDARARYSVYADLFKRKPPAEGPPLVVKGQLKASILAPRSLADVKGTAAHVHLALQTGRPLPMTEMAAKKWAAIMANEDGITYTQALRKIYSQWGYGERNQARFRKALTQTLQSEMSEMGKLLKREIIDGINASSRPQSYWLRGK